MRLQSPVAAFEIQEPDPRGPDPLANSRRGSRLAEGDGWVYWSGLATLAADLGKELVTSVKRLLTA
jgi:hypothetical protein